MWLTPCDKCGIETENIWMLETGEGLCYQCADEEKQEFKNYDNQGGKIND